MSVVITAFNYGRYLDDAIVSVLDQTFPQGDVEIIVVDDGSTDNTSDVVKKYADRIQYIYKENGGQPSACNAGFRRSTGKLIAFLDADDFWYPEKLAKVVAEFEKAEGADVVYHYVELIDPAGAKIGVLPDPGKEVPFDDDTVLTNYLNGEMYWSPQSGMTIRADCLKRIMPIPEEIRTHSDRYIGCMVPLYARRIALIRESLGGYRMHENSVWASKSVLLQSIDEVSIDKVILRDIGEHAERLGYDASRLKESIRLDLFPREIMLHKHQGHGFRALGKALSFRDPAATGLYGLFRKVSMIFLAVLPLRLNQWLRDRYANSLVHALVNRLKHGSASR